MDIISGTVIAWCTETQLPSKPYMHFSTLRDPWPCVGSISRLLHQHSLFHCEGTFQIQPKNATLNSLDFRRTHELVLPPFPDWQFHSLAGEVSAAFLSCIQSRLHNGTTCSLRIQKRHWSGSSVSWRLKKACTGRYADGHPGVVRNNYPLIPFGPKTNHLLFLRAVRGYQISLLHVFASWALTHAQGKVCNGHTTMALLELKRCLFIVWRQKYMVHHCQPLLHNLWFFFLYFRDKENVNLMCKIKEYNVYFQHLWLTKDLL